MMKVVQNLATQNIVLQVHKPLGFLKPGRVCTINMPDLGNPSHETLQKKYHGKTGIFKSLLPDGSAKVEVMVGDGKKSVTTGFSLNSLIFYENLIDLKTATTKKPAKKKKGYYHFTFEITGPHFTISDSIPHLEWRMLTPSLNRYIEEHPSISKTGTSFTCKLDRTEHTPNGYLYSGQLITANNEVYDIELHRGQDNSSMWDDSSPVTQVMKCVKQKKNKTA